MKFFTTKKSIMTNMKADKTQLSEIPEILKGLSSEQLQEIADYLHTLPVSVPYLTPDELEKAESDRSIVNNLFKSLESYQMLQGQHDYVKACRIKFFQKGTLGQDEVQNLRSILNFLKGKF
jgi:hypothetical protein